MVGYGCPTMVRVSFCYNLSIFPENCTEVDNPVLGTLRRILPLPEPGLNIGLMKQAWIQIFAYRSRKCIKETAFLLITDQSHQSIRDSLMRRAERGKD